MNIHLTANKPGSLFHILDSLSNWSIHTSQEVRKYFELLYPLSKEDKNLLEKYKKIREKYGWKQLDSDFYLARTLKEVDNNLKKRLNQSEYEDIKIIITNFIQKIDCMVDELWPFLIKRKKELENDLKNSDTEIILKEIADFYNIKKIPNDITVHLLTNHTDKTSGGANIEPKTHLTLEPARIKENDQKYIISDITVILHESLHIIESFIPRDIWKDFEDKINATGLDFGMVREAIADSLVPDGFLAEKHKLCKPGRLEVFKDLKIPAKENDNGDIYYFMRQKLSYLFYELSKEYIEKKKNIFDGEYIPKIVKICKII